MLPATPLLRHILFNPKEFKENLLPCAIAEYLWAYVAVIMKVVAILARLILSAPYSWKWHLDSLLFTNVLKNKVSYSN
jgi:hypothetical protein